MKRSLFIFFICIHYFGAFSLIRTPQKDSTIKLASYKVTNPRSISLGVIPIPLLNPGAYFALVFKKCSFEYRYECKLPSSQFPNATTHSRYWNYYSGHNHFGILNYRATEYSSFGIILNYRTFRFSKQHIPNAHSSKIATPFGNVIDGVLTSSSIKGPGFGLEYGYNANNKPRNFGFFLNFTFTYFKGDVDEFYKGADKKTNLNTPELQMCLGLKLGLQKDLHKKKIAGTN